ncbi:hypothetical protein DJ94_2182 [Bacillus pseudomycoides]|nr:hypothetical protein DJ94_2182 [Bacillus pseudomycoides]
METTVKKQKKDLETKKHLFTLYNFMKCKIG